MTRPWRRACGWLAFLAPFFYLTYGLANAVAARRHDVPSIVFAWEHSIPFIDWTIIPYWSINVFYAASFFVCATKAELDVHGRRLLTAQLVAVTFFILLPLRLTFERPESHGVSGMLFDALASFDKPFNQAPSLHIALLVILWSVYERHIAPAARWPLRIWFVIIGLSVLTTFQHHFIDIPTGALLGVFCLWLWPDRRTSPLAGIGLSQDRVRLVLATRYMVGAAVIAAAALWIGGVGLWLLWPSVSLLLVAVSYAALGAEGFQKNADGRMSPAACLLLAPYLAAAFVNSRSWTWREPKPVAIADGVWLGRIPTSREASEFATVVDMCAELPGAPIPTTWKCIPTLDLIAPQPGELRQAAASVEHSRSSGPVLVCCALGYSRSAATVATWLIMSGASQSATEAVDKIRQARPGIVIDKSLQDAIVTAAGPQS